MAKSNQLQKSNPFLVVQDNEFINFRHTLTVQEARVFLSVVSQVEKDDIDFKPYKIDVEKFVEAVGLKRKDMYSELKKVSDQLTSKKFRKEKEDGSFLITNYISSAEYRSGEGFVELTFDPKLKPYLLGLKSHFTQYDIRNILSLRSIFSILLFQQLKQFEKIGQRTYNLIDLKFKLNVDDKFKQYNDFKRFVLEVAEKEIKENCDIYFKFVEIKKGRKVVAIEFYIYSQTPPREKIKLIEQPKPKPQDEPSHISNLITDVPFVEIQDEPKQEPRKEQPKPQSITTPPTPTGASVPSESDIQQLADKLKLNPEQVQAIKNKLDNNIRVFEVLQGCINEIKAGNPIKSNIAYILGSIDTLGLGIYAQKQEKLQKEQEKQIRENAQQQEQKQIKKIINSYNLQSDKDFLKAFEELNEEQQAHYQRFIAKKLPYAVNHYYTNNELNEQGKALAGQYDIFGESYDRDNEILKYARSQGISLKKDPNKETKFALDGLITVETLTAEPQPQSITTPPPTAPSMATAPLPQVSEVTEPNPSDFFAQNNQPRPQTTSNKQDDQPEAPKSISNLIKKYIPGFK